MKKLLYLFLTMLLVLTVQNTAFAQIKTEAGTSITSYHEVPVSSSAFSGHIAFELSCQKINGNLQYFIYVSEHLKSAQPMRLLNFNYEVPVKVIVTKTDGTENLIFTKDNSTIYLEEKSIKYNLDPDTKNKLQKITEIKFLIPMQNNVPITFTLRQNIADEWNQVLAATI